MTKHNSNNSETDREIFDRIEAARRLGVSVVTVDRLIAKKRLAHYRIGRRVLFRQHFLDQFLSSNIKNAK